MFSARGRRWTAQRQLILSRTQAQHNGIAYDHRRMNYVGVSQWFTGSRVRHVKLFRQLDSDLLSGYLPQSGIVVNGNSISTDNPRDRDVVFNNRENLSLAKAVARHLCLIKALAVSRQYLNSRPDAGVIQQRVNERTITCAAKLFRAQLWILVEKCVEINSPPLANAVRDDSIRLSYSYQRRAARRSNVRLDRNQTAEILCSETPTLAFISDHQLPLTRL